MKKIFLFSLLVLGFTLAISAQDKPKSPPMTLAADIDGATVTIKYSSPSVRGRDVWGALVPYDKVWRTGANDATTIELPVDMKVEGQTLAAGTYSLFTVPMKDKWTIIFNKEPKQWGHYSYDKAKDALRVDVTPITGGEFHEGMTFAQSGNKIVLSWENLSVPFTLSK